MSKPAQADHGAGFVFNIERFATDDGKGIRTVVFMKGCALRCAWCANPEAQSFRPIVLFHENNCQGCGLCRESCPQGAIRLDASYGMISDPDTCVGCGVCTDVCLHNARTLCGRHMDVQELLAVLLKDAHYYSMSGGGVTFSGGEPLLQSKFIRSLSMELKKHSIPALIETCGHVSQDHFDDVLDTTDSMYFDIKHIDSDLHKKYTGKGNELILGNLTYLSENYKGELSVRYPYIPGINDDAQSIDAMVEAVCGLRRVDELVFLPYHRLGLPKYKGMGLEYQFGEMKSLKKDALYHLLKRYQDCGIPVRIQ
jgi:pyruvate formate lyase activating enzyme